MPHYVYLYRDEGGQPRYVGYGELVTRASVHLIKSHNPNLAAFVLEKKFTIEVAGPFESEAVGRTVETTLISALKPDLNVVQGSSDSRFRPLGVPKEYASRLQERPLLLEDFISVQGTLSKPALFVTVGDKDFGDGRTGYNPANPPSDEQVLKRVDRWWQLSRHSPEWVVSANESPSLLIGVNGKPGTQIVIASILIDRNGWNNVESIGEGKISVPTLPTPNLDAFKFRGRRIDKAAGIAFGGIPAAFFMVLKSNGTLIGGKSLQAKRAD
jgi:hypothetical protein